MENARLEEIARRHGIRLLLQFGSTVSGRVHPRSDVDLAVLLHRPSVSLRERADLLHDLQSLYPDREVDLVLINHSDPLLLKKIMEAPRLIYGTVRQVQELRIYAFKRHQDHGKYFDLERRFVARMAGSATVP
ncbi:MAG: nucleotidyltransferase domain-containing protein [Candidatus Rokubacteria bacterium]|nr:nucleotidyltransferase domain-containing protein [Candidatus Rokubacteria bacterium]